jgi:hypothetical protein
VLAVVLGVTATHIGVFCEAGTKYLELATTLNALSRSSAALSSGLRGPTREIPEKIRRSREVPPSKIFNNTEITERRENIQEQEVIFIYYSEIMINSHSPLPTSPSNYEYEAPHYSVLPSILP